jgi:ribosomal protein S18 acetylase RimI-like enzyme
LDGVRSIEDVLRGYQAAGTFDPSRWMIVRHAGQDAGCLLLTEHASAEQQAAAQRSMDNDVTEEGAIQDKAIEHIDGGQGDTEQTNTPRLVAGKRSDEPSRIDSLAPQSPTAADEMDLGDRPTWELVYMGLLPIVRGSALGLQVVRHAQWLARLAGSSRLVLAVDSRNEPALRCYERAGFLEWERRAVHLKIFGSAQ